MPEDRSAEWTIEQAVDPDVDVHVDDQRTEWVERRWLLPAASLGGMVGALMRYLVEQALPHQAAAWPMATFLTNATGCFLLGLLMAVLGSVGRRKALWRILLGVGVLGGYTTFSTYTVQAATLVERGTSPVAVVYLLMTIVAACASVLLGQVAGRVTVRVLRMEVR